jgi:hypothetical protein
LASFKFLLRRSRSTTIFIVGLALVCVGGILEFSTHKYSSAILLSIGSSIAATVLVWLMTPANEEAYEEFLSLGISKVYPSRDRVDPPQWVKWLRSAKRACVLLGTSHSKWCTDPDFRSALEDRLRNDVTVHILFLDPTGEAASVRAKEERAGRDTVHEIRTAIRVLWTFRAELVPELQAGLKLSVYDAMPSLGVTWIDNRFMVASHILPGSMNVTSPCLLLELGRYQAEHQGLYEKYVDNIQLIVKKYSTEIIDSNVDRYLPQEQP